MGVRVKCGCGKGFADEGWGGRSLPWQLYVTKGHPMFKAKSKGKAASKSKMANE